MTIEQLLTGIARPFVASHMLRYSLSSALWIALALYDLEHVCIVEPASIICYQLSAYIWQFNATTGEGLQTAKAPRLPKQVISCTTTGVMVQFTTAKALRS